MAKPFQLYLSCACDPPGDIPYVLLISQNLQQYSCIFTYNSMSVLNHKLLKHHSEKIYRCRRKSNLNGPLGGLLFINSLTENALLYFSWTTLVSKYRDCNWLRRIPQWTPYQHSGPKVILICLEDLTFHREALFLRDSRISIIPCLTTGSWLQTVLTRQNWELLGSSLLPS